MFKQNEKINKAISLLINSQALIINYSRNMSEKYNLTKIGTIPKSKKPKPDCLLGTLSAYICWLSFICLM